MRKDMGKLLVERARSGSSNPSRRTRWSVKGYDPDGNYDLPVRESSSRYRQYGFEAKEFSENFAPAKRFLQSAVGRSWDEVYTEIRQGVDVRSITGQHFLLHLWQWVEKECFESNGQVFETRYGRPVEGLYVHPRTRLLQFVAKKSKAELSRKSVDLDKVALGDLKFYRRLAGVWYFIQLASSQYGGEWKKDGDRFDRAYADGYVLKVKRQLSSKEIRRVLLPMQRSRVS